MRGLLPKSLLGQMLLLIGAALLVAQAVNLAFILNEQQKLSLARSDGPAVGRFTQAAAIVAATAAKRVIAGPWFWARLNFCRSLRIRAKLTSWATSKASAISSSIWPSRLDGSSRLTAAALRRPACSRRRARS